MLTVGFGDITPQTTLETLFSIITTFLSYCLFALSMNVIGGILDDLNAKKNFLNFKLLIFYKLTKERQISNQLSDKGRNFFEFLWTYDKKIIININNEIIEELPSSLKKEIIFSKNSQILLNHPKTSIFFNFGSDLLKNISLAFEEKLYFKDDFINYSAKYYLCFIFQGKVTILLNFKKPLKIIEKVNNKQ